MRPIYDLASVFADQIRTAETEATRVYEPVIALVTDNKDPSKLGRVKIKIPVLSNTDTTWWAPIVMLGAGKNRGWFFIPEVDDEVLVLFEHGDMSRPLVIGALWNGKDKPPRTNSDGKNDERIFQSRKKHFLLFDDGSSGVVELAHEKGRKVVFDDNGIVLQDEKGNSVKIDSNSGAITIEATGSLTIKAATVSIQATGTLDLKASGTLGVRGSLVNIN